MRFCFLVFPLALLLASCATLLNGPCAETTVCTNSPAGIIYKKDTLLTHYGQVRLIAPRSRDPLRITVFTDSICKKISVKPRNSCMFYSNIFFNYGIGMLPDLLGERRFTYPKRIYVDARDTVARYRKYNPAGQQGEWLVHLSLPHINTFRMLPEGESPRINAGFWGILLGLDYFYRDYRFINFSVSGVSDFFVPVPAAVDISGEYELMSSRYMSLSHNHKMGRFTTGYGICLARNTWDFRYYDQFGPPPPSREPVKKSMDAIGMVFPVYYKAGQFFSLGLIYRPTFYRPGSDKPFAYEHLISMDFAWKFRLIGGIRQR